MELYEINLGVRIVDSTVQLMYGFFSEFRKAMSEHEQVPL